MTLVLLWRKYHSTVLLGLLFATASDYLKSENCFAEAVVKNVLQSDSDSDTDRTLQEGDILLGGENLEYSLVMQGDCNLVLYDPNNNALGWSGTNGAGTGCYATIQVDGNFVLYGVGASKALWATNQFQNPDTGGQISVKITEDNRVTVQGSSIIWQSTAGLWPEWS